MKVPRGDPPRFVRSDLPIASLRDAGQPVKTSGRTRSNARANGELTTKRSNFGTVVATQEAGVLATRRGGVDPLAWTLSSRAAQLQDKEARHAVALVEWGLPRQTTGADRRRILAGPFELAITRSDGTAEVPEPQGLCRRQVMFVLPPGVVMGRRSR
jgi:hypothetical protein